MVGEAHAGWDTKATFEYSASMSSSFEIAYTKACHFWRSVVTMPKRDAACTSYERADCWGDDWA
ncbi:hypothetical protein [Streptomyces sp. Ag109_G2-15]|uniref:hypothetical protein n=1 Tax=Streptomyces sp. Ag109_G2-15 TaxID=1938850 RepID=UPI000BCFB6F3|nr:hypothetical protein [Streptomyces sp. Ag109_G2-15]SOD85513.1 hypothetical protein SAMN06272765_2943 [Streptomyces sp. Ag109_G2-15]